MKLVFYSIVLNHHQACVADEFYKLLCDDYIFVELIPCKNQKGSMDDYSHRPYLLRAWESAEKCEQAMLLAKTAETCVFSSFESLPYQKERLKLGLLSFDMGERWMKRSFKNLLSPRIVKMIIAYHLGRWNHKPLYKLCCSAYACEDHDKLVMYKNRCFKWGYFTEVDETFERQSKDYKSSPVSFMWCARFLDWKHPELPIMMATELKAQGYEFTLDYYGTGVREDSIKKLATEKAVDDVVNFHGNQPNHEIVKAMREHDVFLFTSDQNEGWGVVANESMSNGCVLIGSKAAGSTPYLIENRLNGLTFDSNNVDSLIEKAKWLMDNTNEIAKIQNKALETMRKVWSPTNAAKSLLSLVANLRENRETSILIGPCSKAYPNNKNMPKILQINVTANWGSTGRIAEECNEAAMAKGWDCYLAYSRMSNPSKSKLIKIGSQAGVKFAVLETRLLDRAGLSMRLATKRLIKQIEEIKPDIIHLHNIHGYVLNYKILFEYLNKTDIKVVWTFHDFWAITGHCAHFISKNCMRWQISCFACPMHKGYPSSYTDFSSRNFKLKKELFTGNRNLYIVAVSKWVGDYVKQSFLKNSDIFVIANGIDTSVFKPTPGFFHEMISDNKFVIMGVASQWKSESKGFAYYLKLSKILKEDELIVLVGVTDDIITSLPSNIIGINRTNSQQELASLYTRADVVTILSSVETFGLTVIEGYACGTPAVVFDNTAPPSLIAPQTGYVAKDKDCEDVYEKIQHIKRQGKSIYTRECIELANVEYEKNKQYKKYLHLYSSLV